MDDLKLFIALSFNHQGSGKIPLGYHKVDLRGTGIFSKSRSNTFEAKLADSIRTTMINSKMYFIDEDKQPKAFPGLLVRYTPDKKFMDIRIDTSIGGINMLNQVDALMTAVATSPALQLPIIGRKQIDSDGGYYYRFNIKTVKPVFLDATSLFEIPYNQLSLGSTLKINYDSEPHLLISGGTGSGKTYLQELLLAEMVKKIQDKSHKQGAVYVADPKYSDLAELSKLIGVTKVAQSPNQICGILREADQAMNDRYKSMPKDRQNIGKTALELGFAPIFIVIDEYSALISSLQNKNGKKVAEEINNYLTEIIQKGRQADVYLVLAMQRASTDAGLSSNIRYNFSTKIILGNSDATTLAMIFGSQKDNQLPQIEHVGGGYYIKNDDLIPQKFYSWKYDLNELIDLLEWKITPMQFHCKLVEIGSICDRLQTSKAKKSDLPLMQKKLAQLSKCVPQHYQKGLLEAIELTHKNPPDIDDLHYKLEEIGDDLSYELR